MFHCVKDVRFYTNGRSILYLSNFMHRPQRSVPGQDSNAGPLRATMPTELLKAELAVF